MIGAGGVATVAAYKIAQNQDVFTEFMIASRRKAKCDRLVDAIHAKGYKMDIKTAEVDADDVEQLKVLFSEYKPDLVLNLALPYQDLTIMDACLACGCNYLDTANYEPKDEAHFPPYSAAGLIRACRASSPPMPPSTISTRYSISTSWTAMPETIIKLSPRTSIRK